MERLANTLGYNVVGQCIQKRSQPSASTYLGSGKLDELIAAIDDLRPADSIDALLIDDDLSPRQMRELTKAAELPILDRTACILRIFEQHARTATATLQVEIARLNYELPHVRDNDTLEGRQGGGGRGERGHTNVELEKQRIRDRIAQLRGELDNAQAGQAALRDQRSNCFQVALVGYTNAGKSTLMRALTDSEVLVKDQLFATLGTTVRQLDPPVSPTILLTDTVGFISRLPHELVASFRSTLEVATYADLVVLVVDGSDPAHDNHLQITRKPLEEIGAGDIPTHLVVNKTDQLDTTAQRELAEQYPDAQFVSPLSNDDVNELRSAIIAARNDTLDEQSFAIPYSHGELVGELYDKTQVITEHHSEFGTSLHVRGRPEILAQISSKLPPG